MRSYLHRICFGFDLRSCFIHCKSIRNFDPVLVVGKGTGKTVVGKVPKYKTANRNEKFQEILLQMLQILEMFVIRIRLGPRLRDRIIKLVRVEASACKKNLFTGNCLVFTHKYSNDFICSNSAGSLPVNLL